MKRGNLYKWVGIIAILISGLIHLYNAPDEFRETPYMGILFYVYFFGSIFSALGIYRGKLLSGWALGGVLSIGAIIGYLLSRTIGMPLMEIESWGPPLAYFSLILEFIFLVSTIHLTKVSTANSGYLS